VSAVPSAETPPRSALAGARTELPRASLLACVHCGLCLNECPTYRVTRFEPASPRGRIYLMRAIEEGRIEPEADVVAHLDSCLNCRACETACPAGVHYGDLLERTRARLIEAGRVGPRHRITAWALRTVFASWERIDSAVGALRLLQRSGLMSLASKRPFSALLPPSLRAGASLLPEVPSAAERSVPVGVFTPYAGPARARVAILVTCVVQPLYPRVTRALIHLLRVAGCEVVVPASQSCCGSLHAHAGLRDEARRHARSVIEGMPDDVDYVAVASAGCGASMKEYEHLFVAPAASNAERERASRFAAKVRDGLELLDQLGLPNPPIPVAERIAVHDPCHLAHAQRVREAPRRLMRALHGASVCDLRASDRCCGSAGIYMIQQPAMAQALLEEKLQTVTEAHATVVAVANPGCLLHMAAGARARGMNERFEHPLEILARAYPAPAESGHADPAHSASGHPASEHA
jgi:glycolate oxidase iron-sulfur subunit